MCRTAAGACDVAERCTGASAACPGDALAALETPCTDDGNACTLDRCDGETIVCHHDADPACACGNAIVEPDEEEQCDAGTANGTSASCCTADCTWRAADVECRPSTGACDVAERCSGSDGACPADARQPDGAACDDDLFCNGADGCADGQCSRHAGDPCRRPDGDASCVESCDEATQTCSAPDPDDTPCDDGDRCTAGDRCSAGVCASGEAISCPAGERCDPGSGQCGPAGICLESCDDANPCTTDVCQDGACVHTPVADGGACEDADECTTGTNACAAGTCGTRECDADVRQVVREGVPKPAIELECTLVGRKRNGRAKTGSCAVKVLEAPASAASVAGGAAKRRPRQALLAMPRTLRIRNGVATLELSLNARGRALLGSSASGTLLVDVRTTIRSRGTKARLSKLLTLRR